MPRRLGAVRRRTRWVALGTGAAAAVAALVGVSALTLGIDWLVSLPPVGRFVALVACVTAVSVAAVLTAWRAFVRRLDDEALALRVEAHFGGMRNLLISALQLRHPEILTAGMSAALVGKVQEEAVEETAHLDLHSVVGTRWFKRLALAAAVSLALAATYSALYPSVVQAWAARLLTPFDPALAYPTRTHLTPLTGDLAVPEGDLATVAVQARGSVPEEGHLRWRAGDEGGRLAVGRDTADRQTFRVRLGPINRDTWYAFEVGDARTAARRIAALARPRLTDLRLQYRLPPYTRLPDPPAQSVRDVEALVGTEVLLEGQARVPALGREGAVAPGTAPRSVDRALLVFASGTRRLLDVGPGGTIRGRFTVRQNDSYQIVLAYDYRPPEGGPPIAVEAERPVWYRVQALPDKPPVIQILEPEPRVEASPVGEVRLRVNVVDDYGVESAHLCYAVRRSRAKAGSSSAGPAGRSEESLGEEQEEGAPVDRKAFTRKPLNGRFGSRRVALEYDLSLTTLGVEPGARVFYYVTASDGCDQPAPNVAESEMYEIRVVSIDEIERRLREERQSLWGEIHRIYQRESDLRGEVDDIRAGLSTSRPAPPGGTSRPASAPAGGP